MQPRYLLGARPQTPFLTLTPTLTGRKHGVLVPLRTAGISCTVLGPSPRPPHPALTCLTGSSWERPRGSIPQVSCPMASHLAHSPAFDSFL